MPIGRATVINGSRRGDRERLELTTPLTRDSNNASSEAKTDAFPDLGGRSQRVRQQLDSQNHNRQNNNGEAENARKLSPFADGYDARGLYSTWMELNSRLTMSDWACYIRTSRRRKDRTQVDELVRKVCCEVLGMRELPRYSANSGQNCLLWLNSNLSRKYIHYMRKGAQIIGRVFCDALLKDKQSMCNLLSAHMYKEWLEYPRHVCSTDASKTKRSVQRLCRHQYLKHCMSKCIDTESSRCPNYTYNFCECFRRRYFLPESFTFSHYSMMEEFLKKYETDEKFSEVCWLAKPAYLSGGRGIFMIRNASEFRFFFLVRSDTCVRREGFVVQRYLDRTCTMFQCKVDCRMYLLIMVLNGRRVCGFFNSGYTRIAPNSYSMFKKATKEGDNGNPIFEHLTSGDVYSIMKAKAGGSDEEEDDNVQCTDFNTASEIMATNAPRDKNAEKESIVPFATDEEAANAGGGQQGQESSGYEKFQWRFKYMIKTICKKLDPIICNKVGTFQIFGLDILIDSDTKPWLLEINSHVATERIYDPNQAKIISNVVTESICLTCEMLQKSLQEEEITMELHQGNMRLSKLSRAQRLLTALDEQKKLDELADLIRKTEISAKKRPIFLKNFFWWYDTPRYRWIKPWVHKKIRPKKEAAWQSRLFTGLIQRSEALAKKTLKSAAFGRNLDLRDFHKHAFWRETLETQMKRYEKGTLGARETQAKKKLEDENPQVRAKVPSKESEPAQPFAEPGSGGSSEEFFEMEDDNAKDFFDDI